MDILLRYKKPLLILAGILILAEVAWGAYILTRPVGQTEILVNQNQSSPTASLNLQGPKQVRSGENFKVDIVLKTDSPSSGVDIILKYDPNTLEIVPNGEDAATLGNTFQDYPSNDVDSNGVITISGVTPSEGFVGQGVFASINFRAKTASKTRLSLEYTKDSTTDSNVIESSSGRDILDVVNNLEITITN